MRVLGPAAIAALLLAGLTGLPSSAQAGPCCTGLHVQAPATIRHDIFYRHHRRGHRADPYAYYYEERGYYPYYQSGYWRSIREVRRTYRRRFGSQKGYGYYPSWGNPWGRHREPRKRFAPWHY